MPTHEMARIQLPAFERPAPPSPVRETAKHLTRKQRQDRNAKRRRRREEQMRQAAARERNGRRERSDFQRFVAKMGNWQRNQWARAGYPGLDKEDVLSLQAFFSPRKWQELYLAA